METISSLSNPLVKKVRSLKQKKARTESGTFVVEGIHHVGEVVEAGWDVEVIIHSPELLSSDYAKELLERASSLGITLQPVAPQVIESLAGKENPQGILAVVQQKRFDLGEITNLTRVVALVSPQDPGNLGAILRTMDAIKADALFLLDGGVDLYHPTVIRASMGTMFWEPVIQTNFDDFVNWARGNEMQIIGTSAKGDVEYHTLVPKLPWALVLGSEQKGLSPAQTSACDVTISIPMGGRVSSLNLAVAAGILLYQYKK